MIGYPLPRWISAATIAGGLLAWLGCNALLGIDASTCIEPCDDPALAASGNGAPSNDGDATSASPQTTAGEGEPAPGGGPGASNAAERDIEAELGLDARIAEQCAADAERDRAESDGAANDSAAGGSSASVSAEPFCIDNRRIACGAAGSASVSVCASPDHCERGTGAECAPCSSESVCQGAELWRCDTRLRRMVLADTCSSAALCDAELGACAAAACLPDQTRCQGASFEVCNPSGTAFDRVEQCLSASACDPDAGCQAPECTPGQRRCAGGALQECNVAGTGFDNLQSCGTPALCNEAERRCNTCAPGTSRCASASTVAVCAGDGLTETTRECQPLLEACEDGGCVLLGGLPL